MAGESRSNSVVDDLIELSGKTDPNEYLKLFVTQQIIDRREFITRMGPEFNIARNEVGQLNALIVGLEASKDVGEVWDTIMCLRDEQRKAEAKLADLQYWLTDVRPEGDYNEKSQKTSDHGTQEQLDAFDAWMEDAGTNDDEVPDDKISHELVEEMSGEIDEAKLQKDQMQNYLKNDIVWESRKERLSFSNPKKKTPVVQSCQRDPKAPLLTLKNQELFYLKHGNLGPKKVSGIIVQLHKIGLEIGRFQPSQKHLRLCVGVEIDRSQLEYQPSLYRPWRLSFSKTESGIRLMLAPRSARAKHSSNSGKSHGMCKRASAKLSSKWRFRKISMNFKAKRSPLLIFSLFTLRWYMESRFVLSIQLVHHHGILEVDVNELPIGSTVSFDYLGLNFHQPRWN
ncbi:hypothetical protein Tco_1361541 [Tanacetum coccineum]